MYLLLAWTEQGLKWSETDDYAHVTKWLAKNDPFRWAFIRDHDRKVTETR